MVDKCEAHERVMAEIDTLGEILQSISEWRAIDEHRQDQTEMFIKEIRGDIKETKKLMQEFAVRAEKFATWEAHDRLKEYVKESEERLRQHTLKMFSFAIALTSSVIMVIQFLLR